MVGALKDTSSPILLMTSPEDDPYLRRLAPILKGRRTFQISANPDSAAEIALYAKSKSIKYIVSTNSIVLNKVVEMKKHQSIDNWAGSLYERDGLTYLFIDPFKQLFSVPYGSFITERFFSKLTQPESWNKTPDFSWETATPESIDKWYELFSAQSCICIAVDIETLHFDDNPDNPLEGERHNLIRCIAYTGLWHDGNIHTIVLPIGEAGTGELIYWVYWMRKFNQLAAPKIFQNGLYDCFHLTNYHAPVKNYLFDTQSLFHSWYSELPKSLAFITAFLIHNSFYWKDMQWEQRGSKTLFEYNARDGWATMCSFLALLRELPPWAIQNFLIKFPLWVPCLSCNLEGVKVNETTRQRLITEDIEVYNTSIRRLQKWFGAGFNPRSPKQVKKLISFYGSSDIISSDENSLNRFGLRHPLNARFVREIIQCREISKRLTTYYKPSHLDLGTTATSTKRNKSPLLTRGRLFYSLNPDGTDTGRLACREGANWTGSQIQNQPTTEVPTKTMYEADEGWELFELDNERSESYCVAYLSGDASYLETLRQDREEGKDFHIVNATKLFGVKYEDVTFELRDKITKRVTHGWAYNMQAPMLITVMKEVNIDRAKRLLNLPSFYTRRQVAEHLLASTDKAYPTVKTKWYRSLTANVVSTKRITSPLGWTRYCFGNPEKNRSDLNSIVAHSPQNLSVGIINTGFKEIFWKLQMVHPETFRLKAQIHDSIFGQIKIGNRSLILSARNILRRAIEVTDCDGNRRQMDIPVAMKIGKNWGEMKKITEQEILSHDTN